MAIELISRISNLSPHVTEAHLRELLSMNSLGKRSVRIKKIIMPTPVLWQTCPHGRAEVIGMTDEDTIKVYGVLHGAVVDGSRVNVSFAKVNHALPPSEKPVVKGSSTAALSGATSSSAALGSAGRSGIALRRVERRENNSPEGRFRGRGRNHSSRSWSSYSRSSSSGSDSSSSSSRRHRGQRRKSSRKISRSLSTSSSSRSYHQRESLEVRRTRHSSRHASSTSSSSYSSSSRSPSRSIKRRRTRSGSSTRKGERERGTRKQRTPSPKKPRRK